MSKLLTEKLHAYEQHYAILFRYLENLDRMLNYHNKEIRPYSTMRVRLNFQMIDLLEKSLNKFAFSEKEVTMVKSEIEMILQSLVSEHIFSEEEIELFNRYKTPGYEEALEEVEKKGFEGYEAKRKQIDLPEISFEEYPLMQGFSSKERREHQREIDAVVAAKRDTSEWPESMHNFYTLPFVEQQRKISEYTYGMVEKLFSFVEKYNLSSEELTNIASQVERTLSKKEFSQNTFTAHSVVIKLLQEISKIVEIANEDAEIIVTLIERQNALIREEVSSLIGQEKYDNIAYLMEVWKLNEDPKTLLQQTRDREQSVVKKLKEVQKALKTKKAIVHFLTMPLE